MISVDNVYQKVLAIANKEQRGYITPQEFNLFADQAQMEIFEQYFYDLEQFQRRADSAVDLTQSKIEYFKSWTTAIGHGDSLPEEVYKVDAVWLVVDEGTYNVERLDRNDPNTFHAMVGQSPLTTPTRKRPIYSIVNGKIVFAPNIFTDPQLSGTFKINYIRRPKFPKWTYFISTNQTALYWPDAPDQQNFELHMSEESKLVIKILQLAGINMKDYNLAQLAGQKEISVKQQEKQ